MSELFLNSLEIQNFRAFHHVYIKRLGRINLIVGKNNIGKTSLLEALYIYTRQGSLAAIWDVLEARGEGTRPSSDRTRNGDAINDQIAAVTQLFYGRRDLDQYSDPIRIGSTLNAPSTLTIGVSWRSTSEVGIDEYLLPQILIGLVVDRGSETPVAYTFDQTTLWLREQPKGRACQYVSIAGLSTDQISTLWNTTTLSDREADVIAALQLIEPAVERINLLTERAYPAVVKLAGAAKPVRLRSVGEGMNRLFAITLALVNAKNGVLLVDEIENGLHYSIQRKVWQLIFRIAQRLNVQVFATTHSSDCVRAFQHVAQAHVEEGMLIRLGRKNSDIVTSLYDEELLRMAVEQDVEVR